MTLPHTQKVSIVIPAYNEDDNIPVITSRLHQVMENEHYIYEIIFINDGSNDNTQQTLKTLADQDSRVFFINLSRNFGHQNALKAGYDLAKGNCIISLDADLQHPPHLIPALLRKWEEGYNVVYTRRQPDPQQSYFKRKSSKTFYQFINYVSETKLENGTADFRLIDRQVADIFREFSEQEPFIRGLIKSLGFRQYAIDYQPDQRFSGISKYSFKKMRRLATQGITSFSVRPLHLAIYLGFFFSSLAVLIYIPYIVYSISYGHPISGWSSLIATIVFFGGVNLLVLGIIGIYIGKLFMQSKHRPNYIIQNSNLTE